jgi:hypothetical protein
MIRTTYIYFATFQTFGDRVGDGCAACLPSGKGARALLSRVRHFGDLCNGLVGAFVIKMRASLSLC